MRGQLLRLIPVVAALTGTALTGCSSSEGSAAIGRTASPSPLPAASGPLATAPVGSQGNPLQLSCAQEAYSGYIAPHPRPADLAIGPLFIANGKLLATANPAGYGDDGSYKIPFVLLPGSAVTVTIAASARSHVAIEVSGTGAGGVAAVTYHSCSRGTGFFPQYFTFTHGQTRGCVPLDVTIGRRPRVHHVTLSLFAGTCLSQQAESA